MTLIFVNTKNLMKRFSVRGRCHDAGHLAECARIEARASFGCGTTRFTILPFGRNVPQPFSVSNLRIQLRCTAAAVRLT